MKTLLEMDNPPSTLDVWAATVNRFEESLTDV